MSTEVREYLSHLARTYTQPPAHIAYLISLKASGFEPKVIYDIGACVGHWTAAARRMWPDATCVLFDANADVEFLYGDMPHHIGILTDTDNRRVTYYTNAEYPTGNSYYQENSTSYATCIDMEGMTLDTIVKERGFPLPDLVKIDVQGCERDILAGATDTLKHVQHLIVELQHVHYNKGAPLASETIPFLEELGWTCIAPKFCDNGPDADYGFVKAATRR